MATRFNNKGRPNLGVSNLPTGYEGASAPDDLTIPAVGIEDVDVGLFNLFDKEIGLTVSASDHNRLELKKVPVIFSSAEKWALSKRQRGFRDQTNSLILPLVTVVRTTVQQLNDDITGRGINQQTGEIHVQRRLDKSDRGYQGLINRLMLNHQTNLAVSPTQADTDQLSTNRSLGSLASDPTVREGGLMLADRRNDVYETLVLPAPQFFTAVYEVTLWAQYVFQMMQILEQLIASFLPQGNAWRVETKKGYWFVATVDGNVYNAENNFEDMSQEERLIKYKFTIKLPGYILATNVPGAPVPIKRYVSSPSISFDLDAGSSEAVDPSLVDEPFLGSDDPTLPLDSSTRRADQRNTGRTRLYPSDGNVSPDDPALLNRPRGQPLARYKKLETLDGNGRKTTKFVRVSSTNTFAGETVFAPDADLGWFTIVVNKG